MRYGSVCSGIEAATVAWEPLGWSAAWFAEIEPFPCAVLAHHYPHVPNYGDMTKLAAWVLTGEIEAPDVLVGGTPCQAFSLAGLRNGLDDGRGQLTIKFMELADAIDYVRAKHGKPPCIIVWENVPGVYSDKTNAFGCFLAGLAGEDVELRPAGKRWTDAGCVYGPKRAIAWRTLDAQHFGLAQRRRRCFLVSSARDGFDPAAVLFEWDGVRRDTPPRRESGQETAGTLASRTDGGGFQGTDEACSGYIQPVASTGDISHCLNAGGMGRQDYETETVIVQPIGCDGTIDGPVPPLMARSSRGGAQTLSPGHQTDGHMIVQSVALRGREGWGTAELGDDLSPALRCGGGGGGGDYTLQAGAQHGVAVCTATYRDAMGLEHWPDRAVCVTGDITHTLKADGFDGSEDGTGRGQPIVAFSAKDYGGDAMSELAPTLRAGGHTNSHPNAGVMPAVMMGMAVRRLTPRECERLQGFPDDYTLVPHPTGRRKDPTRMAYDGPRYKAIGNSMAVPCMYFIGSRIDARIKQLTTALAA